ncbi:FMN-binding glutamate synthase family protein [Gemmatimonadota bacterium DH-20]|uniref:FMN-binding glutamate synthase family protein n=1 Tax=Gaopeijia maritima TaxID=3119007 RepID=A0ABU9EB91_9BACT
MTWFLIVLGLLALVVVYDLVQRKHAILRNFPVIGHFRYMLETIGPELRQYIVTSNDEERPFSRDQRTWVYASAKKQNNYQGFGTDNEMELSPNYLVIKHDTLGHPGTATETDPQWRLPCAKVLGGPRGRRLAFRPDSVVNVSGMSFGSLSSAAVEAMNRGAKIAGCLHNTGEGGIAPYHLHGGDLIWQLGTGYFGARTADGGFDLAECVRKVEQHRVKAIEVKISQGAKPGLGGVLPGAKVTAEIAGIRGVPEGKTVISPSGHRTFSNVDELLDFVEEVADATGVPVGIKSAVGLPGFWVELAERMASEDRGVDYIAIDGGEGGTGAAPPSFADHVSLPFKVGFTRVYTIFAERGVHHDVVWMGAGKLGFPETALLAFCLGADMIAVAREAMMAVGCIQAQRCHTGHCPTGVATQNKWLVRGLDPTDKAARLANYVITLRKELTRLSHACGVEHPGLLRADHMEMLDDHFGGRSLRDVFGYQPGWEIPSEQDAAAVIADMQGR